MDFVRKNGQIDEKKLFEHLNPQGSLVSDTAVPTPTAQTTKLCTGLNQGESLINDILTKRKEIIKKDRLLWYIVDLMLNSGCRISEILSIKPHNILLNGSVKIQASKGGNNRIISSSDARNYLIDCKSSGNHPFMDYNRFYIYRAFKKWGIGYVVNGNCNKAVTHAIRHANTEVQREGKVEKSIIQSQLGHTNESTQSHYGGCKKK